MARKRPMARDIRVAESQTFIDGNERLALVSMLTFLLVNGHEVDATDPELADWIIGLSAGTTPGELAELIAHGFEPSGSRPSSDAARSFISSRLPVPPTNALQVGGN
jgi:hypothetical protein